MEKINLLDPKIIKLVNKYSDDILRLFDEQVNFTRSDLQGAVDAIVINVLNSGRNLE